MEIQESVEETKAIASSETAVQSDVQQPGNESPPVKEEDAPRSKRDRRAERRISKLTARNAELAERDKQRDEQFAKMQAQIEELSQSRQVRPQREDFEDLEAYEDAVVDYRLNQQKPAPKQEEPQTDDELAKRFDSFVEDAGDEFKNVVAKAHFPMTEHALGEVIDMGDDGIEVFTYLDKHPADAARISKLSPRDQTIELEKLADSLETEESQAPEPIVPMEGNDKPTVDEENLSNEQWIARRNKKVHGH